MILVVITFALLTTNVFLIVQNRHLSRSLERAKQFVTEEGYQFSSLHIRGAGGSEEKIDLANGELKTLLLIFNSECEYCWQQYPYWRELVKRQEVKNWRILAISSEDDAEKLKSHLASQKIENIKVGTLEMGEMRKARMLFTPMTIVVDMNGEVKKVWPGLWTKEFDLQD